MKGRGDRPARVAERIREEISLILLRRVKDPGLDGVTVTDVTMTGDLKIARVHYSVRGGKRSASRPGTRSAVPGGTSGKSLAEPSGCGTPPT